MIRKWVPEEMPQEEELERRQEAAKEKLASLQLQMKDHRLPVLVLIEGWGAAGKGSAIGSVIRNIDPRFFKVAAMEEPTPEERRRPFLYRYFAKIPEAGKFTFLDSGWAEEVTRQRLSGELGKKQYEDRIESVRGGERTLTDNG